MVNADTATSARAPVISVIIPVLNGGATFEKCLAALRASTFDDYELIVADDGSDDGSTAAAAAAGARVVRADDQTGSGAAAARNRGAAKARGKVLFFTDADVLVSPETLERIAAYFRDGAEYAVIGSYTPVTPAAGYFSKFKNIHHHYIHQISRPEAATFWTGCGAVDRRAFEAVGGFNHAEYGGATIEDIELGYRLFRAGYRIRLAKEIQVTHLKVYTLWSLMVSDIFFRAVPWTKLMLLRREFRSDLNTTPANAGAVLSSGMVIFSLLAIPFWPGAIIPAAAAACVFIFLTWPFNRYVKRHFGWGFTLATVAMSAWYFFYAGVGCGLGGLAAAAAYLGGAKRLPPEKARRET